MTKLKNHNMNPVILINRNIRPDKRYRTENILLSMLLIPGPKKARSNRHFFVAVSTRDEEAGSWYFGRL
jgi:hypothetical protein